MYIKDMACISPQYSFNGELFTEGIVSHDGLRYTALDPDYMSFIPHNLLRRMGRVVKLGIGTGITLLNRNTDLNGIIMGTGYGGLDDCFKFLHQIIEYNEGTLTPTNFVQSTPSAVAGNLALMSKNSGYNSTHVNGGLSFENVLLDAMLLLEDNPNNRYLVGCADELSDYNFNINHKQGMHKVNPVASADLIHSGTTGTVNGEGAAMFVVDNNPDNALAELVDIDQITFPEKKDVQQKIDSLFSRHNILDLDIDAVILGRNGDLDSDVWYADVEKRFDQAQHIVFKNLIGDFQTATGFALWLACNLFMGKKLPEGCKINDSTRPLKNILIYNQYQREQHSFMLIRGKITP